MKAPALILLASLAIVSTSMYAQDAARGPDGGTTTHVGGVELLAVPDKPFSGKSNIEWTRTLEDGSIITTHLQANLARDAQGRMYRERHSFVPLTADPATPFNEIHLYDPVTRSQTLCNVHTKACVITNYFPETSFEARPEGPFANNTRFLARETLGSDTLEGQTVVGTRETVTINQGVVGNNRPLVSTREFWYSAQLQTNVMVTRQAPTTGKQVVWLSDVSLSEPNPELFKVPAGYTVRDARVPVTGAVAGNPVR
jgi:hypothetical protein